jgi:predicted double-glycine peptidase
MKTIALLLLACSAHAAELPLPNGSYTLHVTSLKEARFRSTVRQQFVTSCGSAAVATLLTYHYNTPVTEQQVFNAMYAGRPAKIQREGFSLLDMKRYLAQQGFLADGYMRSPCTSWRRRAFPPSCGWWRTAICISSSSRHGRAAC